MGKVFSVREAARFLGVSPSTIWNWVRNGRLKEEDGGFFNIEVLEDIKKGINTGSIGKLKSRANKTGSNYSFIPREYCTSEGSVEKIDELTNYIHDRKIKNESAIFLLALNLFIRNGDVSGISPPEWVGEIENLSFKRDSVRKHLALWRGEVGESPDLDAKNFLVHYRLPDELDILGLLYQSLIRVGEKSDRGSYYTPPVIAEELVKNGIDSNFKVLDPCCGTGQFLLKFSDHISDPLAIYGFDIDLSAVRIAQTNILLKYESVDFTPNIFRKNILIHSWRENSLFDTPDSSEYYDFFDFIATNPPWGAKFSEGEVRRLRRDYPEISSGESFSFCISQSVRMVRPGGVLKFILPEAFANVRTHRDIRKYLLENTSIQQVELLGKKFGNVLSSAITLTVKKEKLINPGILIKKNNSVESINQARFKKNKDYLFDYNINSVDLKIFEKIFQREYFLLKGKADWALGIVTGDNRKYVKKEKLAGYEPIFKGPDVNRFVLSSPGSYIRFEPEKFQQTASEKKYRAKEKLIYRFISQDLVFAYDNTGAVTLNSANIVIPEVEGYPVIVILGFLNSSILNFFFRKKFHSIKVLKNQIESLPLPRLKKDFISVIEKQVRNILETGEGITILDEYIFDIFGITEKERKYIRGFLNLNYR